MKKINLIFLLFFFIFMIYSLINIKEINYSTAKTLLTFSKTILPALLPFLILNQLIIKLGIIDLIAYFFQYISYPLFKISGKGASIILISLLNGFPSSAIFTSIMLKNNEITKNEAQRLINYIFFPSFSFLFAILKPNLTLNQFIFLILSLYLTSFSFLYLSSFKVKKEENYLLTFKETLQIIKLKLTNFNLIKSLQETIKISFNTLINILGIIVIFSIPCLIIQNIISNNYSYFFQGLIEFSMPSIKLSKSSFKYKTILLSFILPFSGLSSIMQASLFIEDAKLNTKQFITNRLIISIFTLLLSLIFFSLQ